MNLREGTRRLALLLGVVGAIACGFVSYVELDTTIEQRKDHNRFERLANLDVVKQARPSGPTAPNDQWRVTGVEIDRDGIKAIRFTKDYGVESIETEDGQTLYPTTAPAAWQYWFIALLPLAGFFIPWGAVRAMGWVISGFIKPS